jgi:uncharacterized protein YfaS (alpha-2-macroglobulin family)
MRRAPVTSFAILSIVLVFLTGCGHKGHKEKTAQGGVDAALAAVVAGFSGGMVGADGPVRVTLVNPGADSSMVNKELDKNPFEFSPAVKGKAFWADERTVEFRPAERMQRGKTYQATVRLDRLVAVPEKLKRFEFGFTVVQQHFERDLGGLEVMDERNLEWQRLTGLLRLADGEDANAVEKMLTAVQDGRALPVRWEHRPDRREHAFRVDSLRRGESGSDAILSWNGEPVGVDAREADSVAVPSINQFTVLDVDAANDGERFLRVRFSDPIQRNADLRGLIEVPDQSGLRFQVEGNLVKVYSSGEWMGSKTVKVNAGIKNAFGKPLQNPGSWTAAFEEIKPGVRFAGKGVILPGEGDLILPFEAVNLKAVTVRVIRIYAGNMPQFLQVNSLDGEQELRRVGRPVLRKVVALDPTPSMRSRWARYALDLTELARKDAQPGTLYRVSLSFKRSQSTYPCADSARAGKEALTEVDEDDAADASWDGGGSQYYSYDEEPGYYEEGDEYRWDEREDACTPSYYRYGNKTATRNFLASNIGLMAKAGRAGKLYVVATNLLTARPLPETELEILSYQNRTLAKAKTDGDGFAEIDLPAKGFLLRAAQGEQRGYLKIDDASALQLGNFDVGGEAVQEGIKGYLFGERGVWRPGDSLYLTFILEDKLKRLPPGHPLTLELRNPKGQVVRTLTRAVQGSFYGFATATDPDAPTGDWLARVKAGPAVIEERLKIETVVPNRLKIKIGFAPKPLTAAAPIKGNLDVSWLSGATAKNLEAEVEMTLQNASPDFKGFESYAFLDPARSFNSETQTLWQGRIDANGHAAFSKEVKVAGNAPGPLRAVFRTKVVEAGGGFSLDRWAEPFHPYSAYVGVKLPLEGRGYEALFVDSTQTVRFAAVDPQGRKLGRRRLDVKIFKVGWSWWWDRDNEGTSYLQNESQTRVVHDTVVLLDGEASWSFKIKYPDYGGYVIRACDMDAPGQGHCSGQHFYMDWPYSYGREGRENQGGGAAILPFKTDKAKYRVGEKVRLTIPSPKGGRALVSIEKGPQVYRRYWIDLKDKETVHEFEAEPGMAPNAYVYVALLQPHDQTENDLPIRMYNVLPIAVEDPQTRLQPQVKVEPGVFRPGEKGYISVSEAGGKPMEYVVAVVDEGLLDLTRFPTPDPWARFYAREALGVKTWDLYDFVAGAYGSRLERILAIGGDEAGAKAPEARKGNRFPPMVRFLGPFQLGKGGKARHEISIPQYVGAVRVMVVAGKDGAYGHAEQSVFVRKPLMVLGTMPRILAPGETFELPVSVFAMEKHVKDVEVEVSATGPVRVVGDRKKALTLQAPADELVTFRLETPEAVGWSKIAIKASSGSERAEQAIEIQVRNPNQKVTDVLPGLLQPGASWTQSFKLPGVAGTNKATLELSRLPPVDLGRRLAFLLQYPYGCVEQTTSSVFPQLYLDALMDLPADAKAKIEVNVKAAIQRLRQFQTPSGGFGYWPGDPNPNDWASSYAGHFLVEAGKKGYSVPSGMLDQWKKYQRATAQSWNGAKYDYWQPLSQSYRLYTLALAGAPEIGAMNRLKESTKLSAAARWQLGGAYQMAGQGEIASSLVQGGAKVPPYAELNGTFGSDLRDKAMMLDVLCLMGKKAEAVPLMEEVAAGLSKDQWWSTQTTAYALIALARFAGKVFDRNGAAAYAYAFNGSTQEGSFAAPLRQQELALKEGAENSLTLRNKGQGVLYARVILEGVPPLGAETAAANGLFLTVDYQDMKGDAFDVARIEQGADFIAEVKVRHGGNRGALEQLALTSLFPSGWEIRNTRMDAIAAPKGKTDSWFTYQDFRDDRVHTFFSLNTNEERVYRFYLNAAYLGHFHLPQSRVEAMYQAEINARTAGRMVDVVAAEGKAGDPNAPSALGKPKGAASDPGEGEDGE